MLRSTLGGLVAFAGVLIVSLAIPAVEAYQVEITDADPLRQSCSGMWSGKDTGIECEHELL